ncbi:MAG TPA: Spy/CpxP family protein refolding chaperone [Stenomitos sp.]
MRLSQLATVALLGTTLGTGLAVGTPFILNASLPAMAQTGDYGTGTGASEDPSETNGYTPSPVNPGYRQSPTWNNPRSGNKQDRAALLRDLNLSPAQMQKMRSIRAQYKDQLRDRQQQVNQLKEELLSLRSNGSSTSEIRAKSQEFRRLRSEVRNMRSQQLMAMRQILNPNQQSRLDAFLASRRDNFSQERPNNRRQRFNSGYSPDSSPSYTPNYTPNDNSGYTPNYRSGNNSRYDSNYNSDYTPSY